MNQDLAAWLEPLDSLMLECDGLTRVISALMLRDRIEHEVHVGQLGVDDIGVIGLHHWIVLPDGYVCDFRARMWLGDVVEVPHGLFRPEPSHRYESRRILEPDVRMASSVVFTILAGQPASAFPAFNCIASTVDEGPCCNT
jgi:hypothetical protein